MAVKDKQVHLKNARRMLSFTSLYGFMMLSLFVATFLSLGILPVPSRKNAGSQQVHDLTSIVHDSVHLRTNYRDPQHAVDRHSVVHESIHQDEEDENTKNRWVEVISWEPRASLFHNFLSKQECEYLINLAEPQMHKSKVVNSDTGESMDSGVRTSSGTFLARGQDKVVQRIEKRIADFTFIPVEHGEGLQILRYQEGQNYEPHFDYFNDEYNTKNGGQRMATVLMYLSDVEEGGETVFPSAKGNVSAVPWWNELSQCGKGGLSVKPKMGDAVLFWSMKPDATLDPLSLHGACPVIRGTKWSAPKWLRVHEYKA